MTRINPAIEPKVAAQIGRTNRKVPEHDEKARTTALDGLRYRRVWLSSRYAKAHEFDEMKAALDYLWRRGAHTVFRAIEEIWMDSKHGGTMAVTISTANREVAEHVAESLSDAFKTVASGHGDIAVSGDGVSAFEPADFEPDWW